MQIEVNSSELLPSLVRALAAERCLVRQLDGTTCSAVPLDAENADEAALELAFFVSAWAAGHPNVAATVTP